MEAGLVKSVYVEPQPVVKSIEKNVVAAVPAVAIAPAVPIVPAVPSIVINNTATPVGEQSLRDAYLSDILYTILSFSENQPNVIITKPVYPRWYFRKRFWAAPRKAVYVTPTIDSQASPSDVVGGIYTSAMGDSAAVAVGKTYGGSLFDDIFNVS